MRLLIFITTLLIIAACGQRDNDFTVDFNSFNDWTTLTLKSYFHDKSDCGEFGGHYETISIKKEKNELVYYYKRDSTTCPEELAVRLGKGTDKPIELTGQLSYDKQQLLLRYLEQLLTHQPFRNDISNAPDSYEVQLRTEFRTKTFKLSPVENEWTTYEDMREQLIK